MVHRVHIYLHAFAYLKYDIYIMTNIVPRPIELVTEGNWATPHLENRQRSVIRMQQHQDCTTNGGSFNRWTLFLSMPALFISLSTLLWAKQKQSRFLKMTYHETLQHAPNISLLRLALATWVRARFVCSWDLIGCFGSGSSPCVALALWESWNPLSRQSSEINMNIKNQHDRNLTIPFLAAGLSAILAQTCKASKQGRSKEYVYCDLQAPRSLSPNESEWISISEVSSVVIPLCLYRWVGHTFSVLFLQFAASIASSSFLIFIGTLQCIWISATKPVAMTLSSSWMARTVIRSQDISGP